MTEPQVKALKKRIAQEMPHVKIEQKRRGAGWKLHLNNPKMQRSQDALNVSEWESIRAAWSLPE